MSIQDLGRAMLESQLRQSMKGIDEEIEEDKAIMVFGSIRAAEKEYHLADLLNDRFREEGFIATVEANALTIRWLSAGGRVQYIHAADTAKGIAYTSSTGDEGVAYFLGDVIALASQYCAHDFGAGIHIDQGFDFVGL